MNTSLVLVRAFVHPIDSESVQQYFNESTAAVKPHPGFLGSQLWTSVDGTHEQLMMWHYRDQEAADEGIRTSSTIKTFAQRQAVASPPPAVTRFQVQHAKSKLPEGPYLSQSLRIANSGYATDLIEELDRIFEELRYIPGFRGSLVGQNDQLDEEILGICTWESEAAFRASLPEGMMYDVRLYARNV